MSADAAADGETSPAAHDDAMTEATPTAPAGRRTENSIVNPFARGQRLIIPAGTPVRTTHPRRRHGYFTKRATTITVARASNGWIDLWNDTKKGRGYVHLPVITWAGTGGYWCDVKVTPELCATLDAAVPDLPYVDDYDRPYLDYEPAYGLRTDNRDA